MAATEKVYSKYYVTLKYPPPSKYYCLYVSFPFTSYFHLPIANQYMFDFVVPFGFPRYAWKPMFI